MINQTEYIPGVHCGDKDCYSCATQRHSCDELEKLDIYTWDNSIGMNYFKTAPHQADETNFYNKYINRTPRLDFYTNEVIRE